MSRNTSTWKRDGSGWRARMGVLTHDDNTVSESEFWAMAPDGVSVHAARVPFSDFRTYADPPGPDNATALLSRLPLQGIVYAYTIGSYLLGRAGEQALVTRLEERSNGIPVVMPAIAAAAAFRASAVGRIALVHAPFFTDDADQKGVAYFQNEGFDVVHASHLAPATTVPHPNWGLVDPAVLYKWVSKHAPSTAEGIFVAGNGFRSIGVIAALEEDLGRPVFTANQVAFWYVLRLAGVGVQINDYGQLFAIPVQQSQGAQALPEGTLLEHEAA